MGNGKSETGDGGPGPRTSRFRFPRPLLLDIYLVRETFTPFLIGAVAVVMVLSAGLLYDYGPMLLDRGATWAAIGQLVLFRLPFLLVIAAPVGTAVGTAMAVSRLAQGQEILVMRMAGTTVRRMLLPYICVGFVVFGLTYWFQERVLPDSGKRFKDVLYKIAFMQTQPGLGPNEVVRAGEWKFVLGYVNQPEKGTFVVNDITAIQSVSLKEVRIVRAPKGTYRNGVWTLEQPQVYWFDQRGNLKEFVAKGAMPIDQRTPLQQIYSSPQPDEQTREQLAKSIAEEKRAGRDTHAKEVQYHTRISVPFAAVIFSLFGPIFSLAFARSGGFTGILMSVLVVFAHINLLLLFTKMLGERGILPPILAAWGPNIIFLVLVFVAMRRIE